MDSSQFQATMEAIHLRAMEERVGGGEEPAEAHCVRPALQRLSPGLHNVIRSPFQSPAAAACLRSGAAHAVVPHRQTLLQCSPATCSNVLEKPLLGALWAATHGFQAEEYTPDTQSEDFQT